MTQKTNANQRQGVVLMDDAGNRINGRAPLGYQLIDDVSDAIGLTVPAGATAATVIAESQAVRWRDDGTDPDAATGMPLSVGQTAVFQGSDVLAALKLIEQTGGAKLHVSYYG